MAAGQACVIGDDQRAFLAVVRSLGRRGLRVHVCPFDHGSPALRSRHIAAVHALPPYNLDPEAWVEAVRALFARHRFDLVIPCDDRSILPLHRHRDAWGDTRIALPNREAFDAFFDKLATREMAIAAGVPVAPGERLAPGADAAGLVGRYGLPIALKPRGSFDLGRVTARRSVSILRDEAALGRALAGLDRPDDHFVEGFFEGSGVGVSVLADRGELLQAFQHHRVSEAGATGGSTYRVSAAPDPALVEAAARLAAASRLHGVAMFEFRRDMATGRFILIEVNARFWGSLPLAVAAGVDFPAQLYDLLVHGTRHPRVAYRVGHYGRNLANDAYRLVEELGDRAVPLPRRVQRMAGEVATGLGRSLAGRESQDGFARDDLGPWIAEWRGIAGWLGGGAFRRLPWVHRVLAAGQRRRLRTLLSPGRPRRVVVLCFGNICRSPFAAALLRRRLAGARPDIAVIQGGFLAEDGRRSPEAAVAAAARRGVDLDPHRSRYARDAEVAEADAAIVFDAANLGELARRGLAVPGRAIPLGAYADPPGEVADPYGGSAATFDAAYERIEGAVDRLVAELAAGPAAPAVLRTGRGGRVAVEVLPVHAFDAVGREWRTLEAAAERPSFFQSWTWVGCLAEERYDDPVLLRAEAGGRLAGLALFNRRGGRLHLAESGQPALDAPFTEHNAPLVAAGAGPEVLPALMAAAWRVPGARRLMLGGVPPGVLEAAGGVAFRRREQAAPFVDLDAVRAAGGDWMATLSANTRYQLRRSRRALERLGAMRLDAAGSPAEALGWLDALVALHGASWRARGQPGAFADPFSLRFHRSLVERAQPRGELDLLRLTAGGAAVAYLYNFRFGARIYAYQSGLDHDHAGRHAKAGLTCHAMAVERGLAAGDSVYDFLAGEDRYKLSLAGASVPLLWAELVPAMSLRGAVAAAGQSAPRLAALLRG